MSELWKKWKKPVLTALFLTAGAFLFCALFIRFSGWIFAFLLKDYAPVLQQLVRASLYWNPLVPTGACAFAALLLRLVKKRGWLIAVLAFLYVLLAFLTVVVNTVPFTIAVRTVFAVL